MWPDRIQKSPWLALWAAWFCLGSVFGIRSLAATRLADDPPNLPPESSPVLSGNGQLLAYELARQDGSGICDIATWSCETRRSKLWQSAQGGALPDDSSLTPTLDYEGKTLAFSSRASNWVKDDGNSLSDIFWSEIEGGEIFRLTPPNPKPGLSSSFRPSLSADGRQIAYISYGVEEADVVRGRNLCIYHRDSGETHHYPGNGLGRGPLLGAPRFAPAGDDFAFSAFCQDLLLAKHPEGAPVAPPLPRLRFEVYQAREGQTARILSRPGRGLAADANSYEPVLLDKECIFTSLAGNLVEGDSNLCHDIFVASLGEPPVVRRLSVGLQGQPGNDSSLEPAASWDGRWVVFTSWASNLVEGDENRLSDIFLLDRSNARIELLSRSAAGDGGDGASFKPTISADGNRIAFVSRARNLTTPPSSCGVYVWTRGHGLEAVQP